MERGIGDPAGYSEWAVALDLQRYLACSWTGGMTGDGAGSAEPVLPDGCMDIIWDGARLFVAGPDTRPNVTTAAGPFAVGVRFQPGIGPLFVGVPANELRDRRVDLDGMWPDVQMMEDELTVCSSRRRAARLLEDAVLRRVPDVRTPDPLVEAAAETWRRGSAPADIAGLAEQAGITERQVHRRFVDAVGYGPKLLQRVLRFQTFLAVCRAPVGGLAELAFHAGYADQAHLGREARSLAGRTPAELRAARLASETFKTHPGGSVRTPAWIRYLRRPCSTRSES